MTYQNDNAATLAAMLHDARIEEPPAAPALFGDYLRPDLAHHGERYTRRAITGDAPGFVEGVKAALTASQRGIRRDVNGVDLSASKVVRDGEHAVLVTPAGDYRLRRHAFAQLARAAKAPSAYLGELPASIALDAVNWGLGAHTAELSGRTLRLEGDEVRAIVSGRYTALDDRQAYRLVYRALQRAGFLDEAQVEAWSVGKTSTLRVSFGEVKLDDAIEDHPGHVIAGASFGDAMKGEGFGLRAGITVRNAELGNGSLKISSSLWRHWCANGAVIERLRGASWSRRHTGSWEDQAAELAEALRLIIETSQRVMREAVPGAAADVFNVDELQARLQGFKLTRAEKRAIAREALGEACGQYRTADVDTLGQEASADARAQADAVFEALQQRKLEDETDEVLAALAQAPKVSAWDLANGFTAVARDAGDSERAGELEALGGAILADYLN